MKSSRKVFVCYHPPGFLGGSVVKNSPANAGGAREAGLIPAWVRKIPWRRKWQPIPVFLPGKSHGQRSLVGYSPQGCKVSDTTEWLHTHTHAHTFQSPSPTGVSENSTLNLTHSLEGTRNPLPIELWWGREGSRTADFSFLYASTFLFHCVHHSNNKFQCFWL